jgi:hypothetical protein
MQRSIEAMTVAMRVLHSINMKRHPDPKDVAELRRLEPLEITLNLDELACGVITQALKHRTEVRGIEEPAT